jgi:molybdenum cofactor cytidylyltransferase
MKSAVDGIILAAGLSVRMGEPKLLMKIQGLPMGMRVVGAAVASSLSRVIVVTGPGGVEITAGLEPLISGGRVVPVINEHPEKGMSSSLIAGLRKVEREASGAMILLGDQPWIAPFVIDRLVVAFAVQPEKIVLPTIEGRRTTPVVFPAFLFTELNQVTGDVGGREVVKNHEGIVVGIEMGTSYDDADIDTLEDLRNSAAMTRPQGKGTEK